MNMAYRKWISDVARHQIDLTSQRRKIFGDGRITPDDRRVATTIPAHGSAEGDVQIDRRCISFWERCQPLTVNRVRDRFREMRRATGSSRLGGAARYGVIDN